MAPKYRSTAARFAEPCLHYQSNCTKKEPGSASRATKNRAVRHGLGGVAGWVCLFDEVELGGVELDGDVLCVVVDWGDADDGGADHFGGV